MGLIYYQNFKFDVIAGINQDQWELSLADVKAWYAKNRNPEREAEYGDA